MFRGALGAAFLAAALLLGSCSDVSGPVDVWVVTYDPASDGMRLKPERIDTIESVAEGRGSTTRLIKEPAASTSGSDLILEGGIPPTILFSEDSGTVIPQDWDSLTLLSYYHHLEKTVAWFESIGFDAGALVPLPSYYRLEVGFDQTFVGLTDNAAYLPTAHAFLLFESFFFNQIPLAMNDGVVAHEFGHAMFHNVMNGTQRLPIEYRDDWPVDARAHLAGLHEGQSDIWAAMQFDEPDFFRFSLPGYTDRDMTQERLLTSEQASLLATGESEPHEIGAVIASAVWRFSEDIGGDRLRTANLTLAAELAMVADLDENFRLTDFLGRFADACDPVTERPAACALFCTRFDLLPEAIPSCGC